VESAIAHTLSAHEDLIGPALSVWLDHTCRRAFQAVEDCSFGALLAHSVDEVEVGHTDTACTVEIRVGSATRC
jgi:hypothetical protein